MLYYCKKCGRQIMLLSSEDKICDYCSNIVLPVPDKYLDKECDLDIDEELEEQFINECIKSSPEFDQYLFDHRAEDLFKRRMAEDAQWERIKAFQEEKNRVPQCPICQSTNLTKLSSVGKATKIGLFGIFGADDLGKTYKCNHCGSKF